MKHKWKSKPRDKRTKLYSCERCDIELVVTSLKQVNEIIKYSCPQNSDKTSEVKE